MAERITSSIVPWPNNRWRAEVYVDGYRVAQSFHDAYNDAVAWCGREKARIAQEVRS